MRLVVATTNPGKLREIKDLLAGLPVELQTLADYPAIRPPDETGVTFEQNARLKAFYYAGALGELTVAEDSGLEIDALGGAPGVHSARFGGEASGYPEKFELIYQQLARVRAGTSDARFVCALAVAAGDELLFETRATVEGQIAPAPRGTGGFGYDPIFYYPPFGCTLAEAGPRKSTVSHRARAFGALRHAIEQGRLARILSVCLAVAWLFTSACSRSRPDDSEAAARAAATRAHEAYVSAINANRSDAWLAVLADDVVYLVPHRSPIVGKADVGAWLAGYLQESTTHWNKTLQELTVSGDWAIGRYAYTATDTNIITDSSVDGGGSTSDSGWGLVVYHRESDGTWRVSRDAWGSDRPAR